MLVEMVTKNEKLIMAAYAAATARDDLSVGEKELLFRVIIGEKDPVRGSGSGYVLFAGLQANDPKSNRSKAYSKSRRKILSEKAVKFREYILT